MIGSRTARWWNGAIAEAFDVFFSSHAPLTLVRLNSVMGLGFRLERLDYLENGYYDRHNSLSSAIYFAE